MEQERSIDRLARYLIAAGTIVSSLFSDRLTRRLGAGRVTAISVGMTAAALFGFSISHAYWMLRSPTASVRAAWTRR